MPQRGLCHPIAAQQGLGYFGDCPVIASAPDTGPTGAGISDVLGGPGGTTHHLLVLHAFFVLCSLAACNVYFINETPVRSLIRDSLPGSPGPESRPGILPGRLIGNSSPARNTGGPTVYTLFGKGSNSKRQVKKVFDRRSAPPGPVRRRLHRRSADVALSVAVPKGNSQSYPICTESTWAGMRFQWNFLVTFWCGADYSRDTPITPSPERLARLGEVPTGMGTSHE